jgi:septal ring factor EnvC (AmiA/AmiB activator)
MRILRMLRLIGWTTVIATVLLIALPARQRQVMAEQQAAQDLESRTEHEETQSDIEAVSRRIDVVEQRQIDVLQRLTKLEEQIADLRTQAERREGMMDTLLVGIGVLLVEVVARWVFKVKDVLPLKGNT